MSKIFFKKRTERSSSEQALQTKLNMKSNGNAESNKGSFQRGKSLHRRRRWGRSFRSQETYGARNQKFSSTGNVEIEEKVMVDI